MLEQELKLTAHCPSALQTVVESELISSILIRSPKKSEQFLARYHDTFDRRFHAQKCSLRSRLEGDYFRAAFKEKGDIIDGLSQRVELECDIDGWLNRVSDLPESDLKESVTALVGVNAKLETHVVVDMQRTPYLLQFEGSQIECVTDVGSISAAGKTVSLAELELELKNGEVSAIKSLGEQILNQFDVSYSKTTKHQLGLALMENQYA